MSFFYRLIATFFYTGYFPMASGSFASIFGAMIYIIFQNNPVVYFGLLIIFVILGFPAATYVEKNEGKKDPGCIVIDEVVGMMIAFIGLPLNWPVVLVTFFVFRAFDMFKIFPGNRFEKIPGGVGIMLDDVMAGLYTNLLMQLALYLATRYNMPLLTGG